MRHARLFIATMGLLAVCANAMGQSLAEEQHNRLIQHHKFILFGEGEADSSDYANLIGQFYDDQFRHSQDPRAPYFMMLSRNGQMAMGMGGQIKARVMYDWHGMMDGMDFTPYNIPMSLDPARVNAFQSSLSGTSLFFSVFGNNTKFGKYQLYVEAQFNASNMFKLKKAYATAGDFTIGYAKSTFADPASQPSTVAGGGPNSEIDDTRFLVRYMHGIGKNFIFALSVEHPQDLLPDATADYEPGSIYMPNFGGFVQLGGNKQHLRLSGIVKGIRYRNLAESRNAYVTGWGVNLTTVFAPVRPLTVYGAVNVGRGIGSMVVDLACGNNDLIGLESEPGRMYAPLSYGWYAALQYNYTHNVFSTVCFSQEKISARKGSLYGTDQYHYALYGIANVFWEIVPRFQLGAEVDWGRRVDMDGAHRSAYRACMLAQLNF